MAYAMYLRKSRKDDDTGIEDTLARHEKMLQELADRMGILVCEQDVYREVVSGESIEARPQMQRLLKHVELGEYDGVLCVELERLSRGNGEDQSRILKAFQFSDTKIITLNKTYDLAGEDEFDEEFFEFGLFMSRREYKMIKRRLLQGRMQSQQDGYFIGATPPFGYDKMKNPDGKGWILIPNEQTPIVQMIFERYASGESAASIMHELNRMGIQPSKVYDTAWTSHRVRDIIKNRVYLGEINVKIKRTEKRIEDGKIIESRVRNLNHGTVKGKHEPIVSVETFNKCQELLAMRSTRQAVSKQLSNPLASFLHCSKCGKVMRRTTYTWKGVTTEHLQCSTFKCETRNSSLPMVENMILDALKDELSRQLTVLAEYGGVEADDTDEKALEIVESEIEKKDKMLDRVDELYELGDYSRAKYLDRSQKLQSQKADLLRQKSMLEDKIAQRESKQKKAVPILTKVLDEYHSLDTADKNRLLKMIIERVDYTKTESGSHIEPQLEYTLRI